MKHLAPLVVLMLLHATVAGPSAAQEEAEPDRVEHAYSEYWTGTHVGFGFFGGPGFLSNDQFRHSSGMAVGVKLTTALVLQVFHVDLSYLHSEFAAELEGLPFTLTTNGISASLGFHPLFLANLYGPGGGYFGASLFVQYGLSAEFTRIDWGDLSLDESWVWATHLGAGFDFPIDEVDDGGAFWGGFQWRWDRLPSELPILERDETIGQHLFVVRLAYRFNGLPF